MSYVSASLAAEAAEGLYRNVMTCEQRTRDLAEAQQPCDDDVARDEVAAELLIGRMVHANNETDQLRDEII